MKKLLTIIMSICLMAITLCITAFAAFAADEPAAGTVLRISAIDSEGDTVVVANHTVFEDGWNAAMDLANNMDDYDYTRVVVDIYTDWVANNGYFTDDEGWEANGPGFNDDTIYFNDDVKMTLNLNGHTVDADMGGGIRRSGEVMYIDTDADVIINNGTITGGGSFNGAGGIHINSGAKVTLNNVNVVNNVTCDDDGGGIALYGGATLIMNGGSLKDNSLRHESVTCFGGALYANDSYVTLNNVEIKNNITVYDNDHGAAIYVDDSTIVMNGCTVEGNGKVNEAKNADAAFSIIHAVESTITIKNSTLRDNGTLYYDESAVGPRGTIIYKNVSNLIFLDESTLVMEGGNTVTQNDTGYLIEATDDSEFFVSDTSFINNSSIVLNSTEHSNESYFNNCTFNSNASNYVSINFAFASHSFKTRNTITFYDCNMGDSTYSAPEYIRFINQALDSGTVITVSALKTNGTTVKIGDYCSFEQGWADAMALSNDGYWLRIVNTYTAIVVDMHADWVATNGKFTAAFLNGIGFDSDTLCIPEGASLILNMNGYKIDRGLSDTEENGEVIYISSNADVIINDGEITGGHSNNGAGGIHISGGANVTLNNVSVSGNIVENDDGSAIAVYDGATLTMNGGSLENNLIFNTEFFFGHSYGALYLSDASAILTDVKISHNRLSGYHTSRGVAIYINDSNLVMKNCTVTDNGHKEMIGANSIICVNGSMSTLDVTGCKFENNGTPGYVSAYLIDIEDGTLKMKDSLCINNASSSVIYCDDGIVEVTNSNFESNVASVFYGTAKGESKFDSCSFIGNNTDGGYYVFCFEEGNQLEFTNCEFDNSDFNDRSRATFDGAAGVGSIFGEGSLAMIVSFIALIASVAAIVVNVSSKKKAVHVTENSEAGSDSEE